MIRSTTDSRCFSISLGRPFSVCLSEQAQSRLLLAFLAIAVFGGYAGSMLAPFIFSSAFSHSHVTTSDLTPYLHGW